MLQSNSIRPTFNPVHQSASPRIIFLLSLIVLFLALPNGAQADPLADTYQLISARVTTAEKAHDSPSDSLQPVPGELGLLARGTIGFYQRFISSQDKPSCVFAPSCSHFATGCFQHYNPLKALLLTSDRLQRCHSGALGHYTYDPITRRLKDPVSRYDHFD